MESEAITERLKAREVKVPFLRLWLERVGILPILMTVLFTVFWLGSEHFFTSRNIATILTQSVYLIIVSVAQTIVLLTGGFDLSVGASVAVVSIMTSKVLLAYKAAPVMGILLGSLTGLGVATLIGAINGAVISLFSVSPFIVTLAMMSVVGGASLMISGGVPVFGLPKQFSAALFTAKFLGIPVPWVVTILLVALMLFILLWTRLGRYWYAIGGNSEAARLSGVNVRGYLFLAYVVAGLVVGLAGVMLTARVNSGEPNLGSTMPLESIAAAVLGGISIRGGQGHLWGAILGAIFLVFLRNGMDLMGVRSYTQMVVTGSLLILAIIVDRYIHRQ